MSLTGWGSEAEGLKTRCCICIGLHIPATVRPVQCFLAPLQKGLAFVLYRPVYDPHPDRFQAGPPPPSGFSTVLAESPRSRAVSRLPRSRLGIGSIGED